MLISTTSITPCISITPSNSYLPCFSLGKSSELNLADRNLVDLRLLRLGHHNSQDAIVEASLDTVELYPAGETESAAKLADRALLEPELGLGLLVLVVGGSLLVLAGLGHGGGVGGLLVLGLLILDGDLVRRVLVLAALGDGLASLAVVLEETRGRGSGGAGSLHLALDHNGLGVGELDAEVLAGNARELAVELVGIGRLADVELGGEGANGAARVAGSVLVVVVAVTLDFARVVVKVIKEAEEGSEAGVGTVEAAGEHF